MSDGDKERSRELELALANEIAGQIEAKIKELEWSRATLAEEAGVSVMNVWRACNPGKAPPTFTTLTLIYVTLGLSLDKLVKTVVRKNGGRKKTIKQRVSC